VNQEIQLVEFLKSTFVKFYEVHEVANRLEHQSGVLSEISMNAAVASENIGNYGKIFSEIARQIKLISEAIDDSIERIHELVGSMSSNMLQCITGSYKLQKLIEAYRGVERDSNQFRIREVNDEIVSQIRELTFKTWVELAHLKPEFERLKQVVDRIGTLTLSLKVSASFSEQGEEAFSLSIAESLEKLVHHSAQSISDLYHLIDVLNRSLESQCCDVKGDLHVA
jgi:hypothetical protein